MKINLEEVIAYRKKRFESSLSIVEKKGHDYNYAEQKSGNTLANLFACEKFNIVPAEKGILIRILDKLSRLISLVDVENAVEGENIINSIDDIHNYIDYLGIIWERRRSQMVPISNEIPRRCSNCGHFEREHINNKCYGAMTNGSCMCTKYSIVTLTGLTALEY